MNQETYPKKCVICLLRFSEHVVLASQQLRIQHDREVHEVKKGTQYSTPRGHKKSKTHRKYAYGSGVSGESTGWLDG